MTNSRPTITGKIIRLEQERAIIKTADGQEINWPLSQLPSETAEGSKVELVLKTNQTQETSAKNLLNEILKTND